MNKALRYVGQAAAYGVFIAFVGYLSASPTYIHLPPDQALIKLSLSHHGRPKGECRERSDEELARLAPNMRIRVVCPRERSPVSIELEVDGVVLYRDILPPSGFHRDGASTTYRRFPVPTGRHHIRARLNDSVAVDGYNYEREQGVNLHPTEILVIDFNPEAGGFVFK